MRKNYTQSILKSIAYSTQMPLRMKISKIISWLAFLIIMYMQFSAMLMFHFSSIFEHFFIVRWYKGVKYRRSFSNKLQ